MKRLTQLIFTTLFAFMAGYVLQAQSSLNSPYSAFGLGDLYKPNNVPNKSMGDMGIGYRSNNAVNIINPASYSAFDSSSFVFEGAIAAYSIRQKTTDMSSSDFNTAFSHLLFGLPVANWWRSSLGLVPYSALGFKVYDQVYDPQIGSIRYTFSGEGGLSRFLWGNSFQPLSFLSIGFNTSYIFGSYDNIVSINFPDSANMINSLITERINVGDLVFDFGLQFHSKLNEKIDFVLGATFNPRYEMSATRNYQMKSYSGIISGVEVVRDTVNIYDDRKGEVVLPSSYGFGFTMLRKHQWLFGIDYKTTQWSEFTSFGSSDSLRNSHTLSLGGNIVPNRNSLSYFQRVEYRAGTYYGRSYLDFRNENLTEFGITFGVGLPLRGTLLRRTMAMINLGVEIGNKGTLNSGLIRENYFNTFIGISVYEWWFFKRRYN